MRLASNRSRAALFCLLTFVITWTWWGWRFFPYLVSVRLIDRSQVGPLDVTIGMFGPLLAAVIMRLITRAGFKGSLGIRRSWRTYLLAYLFPTGAGILAILINHLIGLGRFLWAGESVVTLAPGMLLLTMLAALTALGEEYGWRGYLLPHLLPLGRIRATLITGLVWGLWHLPLLVLGLTYPGQTRWLAVSVFVLSTTLLSFLFTWFYDISSGSVAIAALAHGALNVLSELSSPQHIPGGNPFVINPFGLTTAVVVLAAVLAADRIIRTASLRPTRPAQILEK